jgi:uncharacterized protein YfcZ (UPF0381/DUF406 family)
MKACGETTGVDSTDLGEVLDNQQCAEHAHVLASDRSCAREQTAVDGINDRRGINHPSAKVTPVQALDGILATLNLVELEVNVTLRVRVDRDVNNMAVFRLGFLTDIVLELLDPCFTLLSAETTKQPG